LLERTRVNSDMLNLMRAEVSSFEFPVSSHGTESIETEARHSQMETDSFLGVTLAQLLKRPEVRIEALAPLLVRLIPDFFRRGEVASGQWIVDSKTAVILSRATVGSEVEGPLSSADPCAVEHQLAERPMLSTSHHPLSIAVRNELKSVETEIKYSGYLDQQTKAIERLKRSEERMIPDWFDYAKVSGLSREMNEKLTRVRPRTLGQASRVPGVTPAAVSLINVYIEIQGRQHN